MGVFSTETRAKVSVKPVVRAGRVAVMPALSALLHTAWPEESSRHFLDDPWFEPSQFRIVEVDGRVVSMVKIHKRPIVWGRSQAIVGGIGDVVTHPMYRRRGYAALALRDACHYMLEHGYDLSLLFTGLPHIYEGLGWMPITQPCFTIESGQRLAVSGDSYHVRQFDGKRDLEAVSNLYQAENADRHGTVVRRPDYWQAQLQWQREDPDAFLVAEARGSVVGYVRGQAVDGQRQLTECACKPGDEASYLDMLAHLHHDPTTDTCGPLTLLVPEDSGLLSILGRHGVTIRKSQIDNMMVHVINDRGPFDKSGLITHNPPFFFWRQDSF